jgi:hypothetical protein
MGRSRKKGDLKSHIRDTYEVSGDVQDRAVVVQGPDAHVDITQREATPSEIRKLAELADLDLLHRTIAKKLENLKKQIRSSFERGHNYYRFGQPLSFKEADLLAGRETETHSLLALLKVSRAVFLAGNGGCGRTSLLKAGLMPALIKQGDLPVFVSVTPNSLELSIKTEILDEVEQTPYLSKVPLSTFIRHVTECLPPTKHVYLFIDELEKFLAREPSETQPFKAAWLKTLTDSPRVHWLFSIHWSASPLLNFFRPEINPFSELMILSLLSRDAAREAILRPASVIGIEIEDAVIDDILDRLGGTNISPTELQTVCYLMAGGNGPIRLHWTPGDYESEGRADGILRQSLERLVDQLKRGDREPAWQVLATLVEHGKESASFDSLVDDLKPYGIRPETLKRLLESLEEIHLVDIRDERYYLASESMRPRIQQWIHEQNALIQARQEALFQLQQLRNSALRGMFGGALGFILFDLFIYTGIRPDISFTVSFAILAAAIGGIVGFILTLTVDLAIATYHGSQTWVRYLVGGIGGTIAFAIGLLLYITNNYLGDSLRQVLQASAVEGALWGAAIGLGTAYVLSGKSRAWPIVLVTALAGGLILMGLESKISVLVNERWAEVSLSEMPSRWRIFLISLPPLLRIFLAGVAMPFCYMAAALFRRRV